MSDRLSRRELAALCRVHNWAQCEYDNNGVLVRSLSADPDANDWWPVTVEQITDKNGESA